MVISAILKKASIGRPGNEENSEQDTKSEAKKKTPKANNSPFSAKVTELILGPEKEISEEKERPKKNQLFHKAIEMYPIILILIQFLKDVYNVFDSRDIGALDMLIHTYSESDVDALAQYVKGLSNDYEAIKNSLVYGEISNGPIEGVNSRIKAIHRRSSGRAGIFLLNAYMVLPS